MKQTDSTSVHLSPRQKPRREYAASVRGFDRCESREGETDSDVYDAGHVTRRRSGLHEFLRRLLFPPTGAADRLFR